MNTVDLILNIAASLLFLGAAFWPRFATAPRVHLGWLGAACFALAVLPLP